MCFTKVVKLHDAIFHNAPFGNRAYSGISSPMDEVGQISDDRNLNQNLLLAIVAVTDMPLAGNDK